MKGWRTSDDPYRAERERMVEQQIITRGITHPRVIEAMRKVPRHLFVPEPYRVQAYADMPLPIGYGQTISQPFMVAAMTANLDPQETDRVLEIGTGSGYQTAILAELVQEVWTIEVIQELQERAREVLEELGYTNIRYRVGDGSKGWPEGAPYDKILVAAASPSIPPPLVEQLKVGGIMVLPVGDRWGQDLVKVTKVSETEAEHQVLFPCAFVPLKGAYGFPEEPF